MSTSENKLTPPLLHLTQPCSDYKASLPLGIDAEESRTPHQEGCKEPVMVTCHLFPLTNILSLSTLSNTGDIWDITPALSLWGRLRPGGRRLPGPTWPSPATWGEYCCPLTPILIPFPRLCLPLKHPWGNSWFSSLLLAQSSDSLETSR